ncbi:MAG: enoyl-CoA hydratase-related protein [Dehalococcoidales bacterium]|nr:enoyl-CoA hydratase-related protein [Dehalococcoidales bacterium]
MDYKLIKGKIEDGLGWVILNRPDNMNALNTPIGEELLAMLDEYERDEAVRVIILTGAGKAFCAGDDIREPFQDPLPVPVRQYLEGPGRWPRVTRKIKGIMKPVIAMVNGHAHGAGFDLSLSCDIRFAAEEATFCYAYILRGFASGTAFLPRYIGIGKAAEFLFTAKRISAKEAESLGLVNRVVPAAELEKATTEFAKQLAQGATRAMGLVKRALNQGWNADFERALEFQALAATAANETEDAKEGKLAFIEKRPPRFKGK